MKIISKKNRGHEYAYVIKRLYKDFERNISQLYENEDED